MIGTRNQRQKVQFFNSADRTESAPRSEQQSAFISVFVYFIIAAIVVLPLFETLTAAIEFSDGHSHGHSHGHDHFHDSTSEHHENPRFTTHSTHNHNHKEPPCSEDSNPDAPCPCLCCPGHMIALEPLAVFNFFNQLAILSEQQFHIIDAPLPTGVSNNIFRPPQFKS